MNDLGTRVKNLRKRNKWTQAELGKRAGVNMWTICKVEKGNVRTPRIDTMRGLADALKVTIDYLVKG